MPHNLVSGVHTVHFHKQGALYFQHTSALPVIYKHGVFIISRLANFHITIVTIFVWTDTRILYYCCIISCVKIAP